MVIAIAEKTGHPAATSLHIDSCLPMVQVEHQPRDVIRGVSNSVSGLLRYPKILTEAMDVSVCPRHILHVSHCQIFLSLKMP